MHRFRDADPDRDRRGWKSGRSGELTRTPLHETAHAGLLCLRDGLQGVLAPVGDLLGGTLALESA